MGNVTGLMIRCTPRAKCNYMLSRASIRKEAAVNHYSSQTVMQSYCSCGTGPKRKGWQHRHAGGGGGVGGSTYYEPDCSVTSVSTGSLPQLFFLRQLYKWTLSLPKRQPAESGARVLVSLFCCFLFCKKRSFLMSYTLHFKLCCELLRWVCEPGSWWTWRMMVQHLHNCYQWILESAALFLYGEQKCDASSKWPAFFSYLTCTLPSLVISEKISVMTV